jgi:hypothetical protein
MLHPQIKPFAQGDTLVRYLLDELSTYEEDHSNALCPPELQDNPCSNFQHSSVANSFTQALTAEEGQMIIALCKESLNAVNELSQRVHLAPQLLSGSECQNPLLF